MLSRLCFAYILSLFSLMVASGGQDKVTNESAKGYQKLTEAEKLYLRKYLVDPAIAAIIDQHVEEPLKLIHDQIKRQIGKHESYCANHVCAIEHAAWEFSWLPNYFIKFHINRLAGIEMLKKCFDKHNLDGLTVPEKKLYHIPGRPRTINDINYLVVEPKLLLSEQKQKITFLEMQQLCIAINETGYHDSHKYNILRLHDGKLAIVDTEMSRMIKDKIFTGLSRFLTKKGYYKKNDFSEDAIKYLFVFMADYIQINSLNDKYYKSVYKQIYKRLKRNKKNNSWKWFGLLPYPPDFKEELSLPKRLSLSQINL